MGIRAGAGGIDRHIHPDDVLIYNVGVERRLPWNFVAGASYSGSHLWNGLLGTDFNRFPGDLLDGSLDRLNPIGTVYLRIQRQRSEIQRGYPHLEPTGRPDFFPSFLYIFKSDGFWPGRDARESRSRLCGPKPIQLATV